MAARTNKILHDEDTKDKIAASQILKFLTEHTLTGKSTKRTESRIAAAKAALPFLRPALSAVEQTNIDPRDALTEEQILENISALLDAHPDLVQRALAKKAQEASKPVADTTNAAVLSAKQHVIGS
jgi:hypothetical protein